MKLLSDEIANYVENSSLIRRMFEAGIELKKKYGANNVYDFSLGNPDLPSPPAVKEALLELAGNADKPFAFGYMPNAGYPETRKALSEKLTREQKVDIPSSHVIATCGAAGGMNAFFRAVLSGGDEVICPNPYFVEYRFYVSNFGGTLKPVDSKKDFSLDVEAIENAMNEKTRAVIINSPNNPTGRIYPASELEKLAAALKRRSEMNGRTVYLVSDEPYRFLNFDGLDIPSAFNIYGASVIIGSFSKSLSLAGERIGYVAVNPALEGGSALVSALILTNRILGFVNAPASAQKIIEKCVMSEVDMNIYKRRRDMMAKVLADAGIRFTMPEGAFYFFPESPVPDEDVFVQALLAERILAVPGKAFGMKGYIRLAFCVDDASITNSAEGFKRAVEAVKQGFSNN